MRRARMQRKTRLVLQGGLAVLAALGTFELGAAVLLRALRPDSPPVPAQPLTRVDGPLEVGAASRIVDLPLHHALAGFGPFRPLSHGSTGPIEARAVVVGKLAIVALDLLEIPPSLQAAVSARVGPGLTVWLCATHTHSGPGGYDPGRLPRWAGARHFQPAIFETIAEAAADAVSMAAWSARPARVRWAVSSHPELKRGRGLGAQPDSMLWAWQALDDDGKPVATLVVFGAHPTLVSRRMDLSSGDWPGAAAEALARAGGVGLALQAIGGDSTAVLPEQAQSSETTRQTAVTDDRWRRYGEAVAAAAEASLAGARAESLPDEDLAQSPARLTWNPLEPFHLRLPGTVAGVETTVRLARLGGATLLCLPGEVTGAAWGDLVARHPELGHVLPLTLCGDELSYVESPRLIRERAGERLILYPRAVPELGDAAARLLQTLSQQ